MASQPHILMCPPDFFGIEYEINPWMDVSRQAEHIVAVSQWHALRQNIIDAGARTSLLKPIEGLPDLVFTANAAMIYGKQALISRFRHRQRQGEEPYNRRWLSENGFETVEVPENFSFEGPVTPSSVATRSTPAIACGAMRPAINKLAASSVAA